MNSTNTFVRYFDTKTDYEIFVSIADIQYAGNPTHPSSSEELDYERELFSFDGKNYNKL